MAHTGASSLVGQSTVNVSKASERRSQTSLGTRPVNIGFISICIVFNSVNSPTSEGTIPLSSFPFNRSVVNFVNCPSSEGISPVNPLSLRRSTARAWCLKWAMCMVSEKCDKCRQQSSSFSLVCGQRTHIPEVTKNRRNSLSKSAVSKINSH